MLRSGLRLAGSPRWEIGDQDVRATLVVHTEADTIDSLAMDLRIVRRVPWLYHYQLRLDRWPIRRLDVRDTHSNPRQTSGTRWHDQTHKHAWRTEWGERWAYTPTDIPPTPNFHVTPGEYREVFEAFCGECHVDIEGFEWVEPTVDPPPASFF